MTVQKLLTTDCNMSFLIMTSLKMKFEDQKLPLSMANKAIKFTNLSIPYNFSSNLKKSKMDANDNTKSIFIIIVKHDLLNKVRRNVNKLADIEQGKQV